MSTSTTTSFVCALAWLWSVQAQPPCEPRAGLLVPDLVTNHLLDLITLIEVTREDNPTSASLPPRFESMNVFEDSNDCAIVARAKSSNTCMAVFQATDFGNPFDIVQLLDGRTDTVEGCSFRAGIASAYFSSYHKDFVAAVDACMATNKMGATPKLLLGGHSQGGAISVAASVDLHRYEPTTVTIGAVRSLISPCNMTVSTNHYRFVNAIEGKYDFWPTVFNRKGMHIGQPIYLDPTSRRGHQASYTYLDDNNNPEPTDSFNHDPDIYWLSISQLFHENLADYCQDELVVDGWDTGHRCNAGPECSSRKCAQSSCQA